MDSIENARARRRRLAKIEKKERVRKATLGMLALIAALVLLIILLYVNGATSGGTPPWLVPQPEIVMTYDEHCCSCDDCEQNGCGKISEHADRAEFEVSRNRMTRETVLLWEMWFDDEGASVDDSRRQNFELYASELVDAIMLYQDVPTDIGGQMPGSRDDHLVMAYWVAKESSLIYDIKNSGPKGEVCLMQLHGSALAGYDPEKVRINHRLCLLLGARWIAHSIAQCKQPGSNIPGENFAWELSDWTGVMSAYSGGPKAIRKDGTCSRFTKMQERIDQIRMYRTRIDREMERREE